MDNTTNTNNTNNTNTGSNPNEPSEEFYDNFFVIKPVTVTTIKLK